MTNHLLAIDTETALMKRALLAPPISCLTYCWEDKDPGIIVYHDKKELYEFIRAWFQLKYVHIIIQNAAYDLAVICAEWPSLIPIVFQALEEGRIHCTMIRQKLLDIALGYLGSDEPGEKNKGWYTNSYDKKRHLITYSLQALHYRRTGEQLEKGDVRIQFGPLRNIPLKDWPEESIEYAKNDAVVLLPLYKEQEKYTEYLEDEAAQVRAAFTLQLISCWGFRTEEKWVKRLELETRKTLDSYKPKLKKIGWLIDGVLKKEPAQKRLWKLCQERNISPKLTRGGKKAKDITYKHLALDEEACERINDPDLILRQKFNSLRTVLSKDIPMLLASTDLPIQAEFDSLLATGRTSSKQNKKIPSIIGGNIQNFRRLPGVRECVIPRKGYVLGSCDYDGAELHTLAQVCYTLLGKSRLGDILNEGKDPHLDMAAQILNVSYEKITEHPKVEETRQFAKIANFGFPGGMVGATLSDYAKGYNVDITPEQGRFLRIKWLENFPEMEEYFDCIKGIIGTGEPLRHLFSNRYRGSVRYTVACNSFFQGLAADGAKAALWRLTRCMYEKGYNRFLYGTRMINFPHDEIIFETEDIHTKRSEVAYEISYIMEEEFNKFVPDCPTKAEPVLMRRWSKKAKPIFNGAYITPWDCNIDETFMDNRS